MRVSLVLTLVLSACAVRSADGAVHTMQRTVVPVDAAAGIEQPVLRAYVQTLSSWMTDEERASLSAIDYASTEQGDAQRLRYLAADHVIRRLLPRALDARGEVTLTRYATLLRRLPPLLDADTDAVAAPIVRIAVHALTRSLDGQPVIDWMDRAARAPDTATPISAEATAGLDLEDAAAASELVDTMLPDVDPEAEAAVAEALASYADAYARHHGVSALEADAMAAAASDVVDTGLVHARAVEAWGLPREVVVEEALSLASEMAAAARRRERLPRTHREPRPQTIPPDAPGSPTRP